MPLTSGGANAYPDLAGLGFGMRNGGDIVRVHVSHEALEDIEPVTGYIDYRGIFERNRQRIESIASRKFDDNNVSAGGIIQVLAADLKL